MPKSMSAAPIFKQMEKIERVKGDKNQRLLELGDGGTGISSPPVALGDFAKFLDSVKNILHGNDPVAKSKILRHLIHRIDVGKDNVKITYKLDESSLLREPIYLGSRIFLCPKSGKVLESRNEKGIKKGGRALNSAAGLVGRRNLPNKSSNSLTYGGRYRIRTCDLFHVKEEICSKSFF